MTQRAPRPSSGDYRCAKCQRDTPHVYEREALYGREHETHFPGSERYKCFNCGHATFARDEHDPRMVFAFDGLDEDPMTNNDPALPEALAALRQIATSTRSIAQRVGGLDPMFCFGAIIDKYVLICEEAVERGEEIRYRAPMRVGLQHVAYLAEKFARTFGPIFDGSPGALRLFVRELVRYGAPAEELDLRELGTPRRYELRADVQKVSEDMIDHNWQATVCTVVRVDRGLLLDTVCRKCKATPSFARWSLENSLLAARLQEIGGYKAIVDGVTLCE